MYFSSLDIFQSVREEINAYTNLFTPPPPLELARCQALNLNDDGQQLNNPYFPILDPIAIWIEKKSML